MPHIVGDILAYDLQFKDALISANNNQTIYFMPFIKFGKKHEMVFTPKSYNEFINGEESIIARDTYGDDCELWWNGINHELLSQMLKNNYDCDKLIRTDICKYELSFHNVKDHKEYTLQHELKTCEPEKFFYDEIANFCK